MVFKNREDALAFDSKVVEQFIVQGSRIEDFIRKEVSETYYYADR